MKRILLTLVITVLSTGLFAQTYRTTSDKGLNMRSEPNSNASVVASIPAGADINVVDKSNSDWYKVSYDGKTGYVSAKHVSDNKNEQARPNNNNNNTSGNNNRNSNNNNNNNNNRSSSSKSSGGSGSGYNTGIGLRFGGWESGITVKHFVKSNAAIEGILSSGWHYRGTRITGLYEWQKPIGGANGLYVFYGVGAHIGFYNDSYWSKGDCKDGKYWSNGRWYDCDGRARTAIGIDGILGLEYVFSEIPFSIGIDLKPSFDLFGWGRHYGDGALTVRYIF
jgi:hypothetical protein